MNMKCLLSFFICCLVLVLGIPFILFLVFNKANWANHTPHREHPRDIIAANSSTLKPTVATSSTHESRTIPMEVLTTIKSVIEKNDDETFMPYVPGSIDGHEEPVAPMDEAITRGPGIHSSNGEDSFVSGSFGGGEKTVVDGKMTGDKRIGDVEKSVGQVGKASAPSTGTGSVKKISKRTGNPSESKKVAPSDISSEKSMKAAKKESGEIIEEEEEEEIVVKKTKKPSKASNHHN